MSDFFYELDFTVEDRDLQRVMRTLNRTGVEINRVVHGTDQFGNAISRISARNIDMTAAAFSRLRAEISLAQSSMQPSAHFGTHQVAQNYLAANRRIRAAILAGRREEAKLQKGWDKEQENSIKQANKFALNAINNWIKDEKKKRDEQHKTDADYFANRVKVAEKAQKEINKSFRETERVHNRMARSMQSGFGRAFGGARQLVHTMNGLRHMLYGIGAAVGAFAAFNFATRIAGEFYNMTKSAIEFNDELRRSETIFTGMGLLGSNKGMVEIMKGGTPAEKARLEESKSFGKNFSRELIDTAVETGQDYSAVVGAAKSLIPDMLDKLKGQGIDTSALLENQDDIKSITKDFIKMGAVLKMQDPMGHNLQWQLYALQELFAGTSGSKQDRGLEMVRSARRRLGIKITEDEAKPIADAVNAGRLREAMDLIMKRFERAGVSVNKLADLFQFTLAPNIDAIKAQFELLKAAFVDPFYDKFLTFAQNLRDYFGDVGKYKPFKDFVNNLGERFAEWGQKKFDNVFAFFRFLEKPEGHDWISVQIEKAIFLAKTYERAVVLGARVVGFVAGIEEADFSNVERIREASAQMEKNFENIERLLKPFLYIAKAIAWAFGQALEKIALITDRFKDIEDFWNGIHGKEVNTNPGIQGYNTWAMFNNGNMKPLPEGLFSRPKPQYPSTSIPVYSPPPAPKSIPEIGAPAKTSNVSFHIANVNLPGVKDKESFVGELTASPEVAANAVFGS